MELRQLAQDNGFQIRIDKATGHFLVCYFSSEHVAFSGSTEQCIAFIESTRDQTRVRCIDCGWLGQAHQLKAEACPICDGRVGEEGSPEFVLWLAPRKPAATTS